MLTDRLADIIITTKVKYDAEFFLNYATGEKASGTPNLIIEDLVHHTKVKHY